MAELWAYDPLLAGSVLAVVGVLGLVVGSFLNCVAWRVVRGEEWVSGRSHCDSCGHELAVRDLVPVLSWLSTRGRCRYCGERVSVRNPVTELLMAAVSVLLVWHFGLTAEALEMSAFAGVLLVLTLTDIDDYVIPNGCIVTALVVRGLYLAWLAASGVEVGGLVVSMGLGMLAVMVPLVVLVLVMDRVLDRPSMGYGDLKLFAVACLYFGWQKMLFLIIVACLLGLLFAVVWDRLVGSSELPEDVSEGGFPFGPAIAAACVLTMLVGDAVLGWYLLFLL